MREEAGLPLTIDRYQMLLQALEGGFGISSRDDLKQVCRLLWIKSISSPQVERFEAYFEQYFKENSQNLAPQTEKQKSKGNKTPINPLPSSPITPATPDSKSANSLQIATAMRGKLLPEKSFKKGRYQLALRDFPVTERQIQQNWRYLRRAIQEGALTEIDIEATVERSCGAVPGAAILSTAVPRLATSILRATSSSTTSVFVWCVPLGGLINSRTVTQFFNWCVTAL